jgi:hypothetical protein
MGIRFAYSNKYVIVYMCICPVHWRCMTHPDLYERAKRGKRSLWSVVNLALARVGKGFDFYGSYCRISAEERLSFHKNIIGLEGEQFTIVKSELFSMLSKSVHM